MNGSPDAAIGFRGSWSVLVDMLGSFAPGQVAMSDESVQLSGLDGSARTAAPDTDDRALTAITGRVDGQFVPWA